MDGSPCGPGSLPRQRAQGKGASIRGLDLRGSEPRSVPSSPVPKEASFLAHRGADVGKHAGSALGRPDQGASSDLWEKVRTSASKSEADSSRSEASTVVTGSSLQEGGSRRPAPSPRPDSHPYPGLPLPLPLRLQLGFTSSKHRLGCWGPPPAPVDTRQDSWRQGAAEGTGVDEGSWLPLL